MSRAVDPIGDEVFSAAAPGRPTDSPRPVAGIRPGPAGRADGGTAPPRIASLLASATEIVARLGLTDSLVAISHECDYPPEVLDRPRASRPRFDPAGLDSGAVDRAVRQAMAEHGSVYQLDAELLTRLQPDLILTQAVCEVCAVPAPGVEELVAQEDIPARIVSLDAHTLEDILHSIHVVAAAAGVAERAMEVVAALRQRLAAVAAAVAYATRPTVLALEWLDPPFVAGHWVPEMVEWAGGRNLVGHAGERSLRVEWKDLMGLDPDVLLMMPCGYHTAGARRDANQFAMRLQWVAESAVGSGRAYVVDGSAYFNRSGPRVVHGIEILAGLLHPDLWPRPDPAEGATWRPA